MPDTTESEQGSLKTSEFYNSKTLPDLLSKYQPFKDETTPQNSDRDWQWVL
jgi:hypothetical protein